MLATRTRSLAVLAAAAVFTACGAALLAQAADAHAAHAVARTAAAPAAQPMSLRAPISRGALASAPKPLGGLQCGWHPANNAWARGYIEMADRNVTSGYPFQGPDPGCGIEWDFNYRGIKNDDYVVVHCGWYNSNYGVWYDYLTDYAMTSPSGNANGMTGWVADGNVKWRPYGGRAEGC